MKNDRSTEKLRRVRAETPRVYGRQARKWDEHRSGAFVERPWLDRLTGHLAGSGRVLDLGCGSGDPVTAYLIAAGHDVTGIDQVPAMLRIARSRYPEARWLEQDIRDLDVDGAFDAILSWDGFFHLTPNEQRRALPGLARRLAPKGRLLLTIGDAASEVLGQVGGEDVYHASLDPEEYRVILERHGLDVSLTLCDPASNGHSVLLARRR